MADVEMMEECVSGGVIVSPPSSVPSFFSRPSKIDDLYAADRNKTLQCVRNLRNWIIGSNKQKQLIYEENLLPKLLGLLRDSTSSAALQYEIAVVVSSLTKGSRQQIACLVAAQTVQALLDCVSDTEKRLVEVCLQSLKTIFSTDMAPIHVIYENPNVVGSLLQVVSCSAIAHECVSSILGRCCLTETHQQLLHHAGIIEALSPGLFSEKASVKLPTLQCFAVFCFSNPETSSELATSKYEDQLLIEQIVHLLSKANSVPMQLAAAKCLTHIYRSGVLDETDPVIMMKVMPTVVGACREDSLLSSWKLRSEACVVLAYLIEDSAELQKLALYNNQCLHNLAQCLSTVVEEQETTKATKEELERCEEMEYAALSAVASLSLSDEEIRRKVSMEFPIVLECCMRGMCEEKRNPKQVLAAVRCLHAMSRSVEQLRTTFQDRAIWKPLLSMATSQDDALAGVASGVLCNLCLEFSPCRETLCESGILDVFCTLTAREEESLKLNGYWGLMNLAYRSDDSMKSKIMKCIGADTILQVLTETLPHSPLVIRLLSLLRNILSQTQLVDEVMGAYGTSIIQTVVFVLEGDYTVPAKELALCILSNIAAGDTAKDLIMTNEDVLRKIINYLASNSSQLQNAALMAIMNLGWKDDPGFVERQQKLRDLGVHRVLQQHSDDDPVLSDRIKAALQLLS